MSFYGEGNFYLSESCLLNSNIYNTIITTSDITACTLDMLSTTGSFQRITNVATPILPNDAVIKSYVDDLGIIIQDYTLLNTTGTLVSSNLSGSFMLTVKNLIFNGPSAVFLISKNEPPICGHVIRQATVPGTNTTTTLNIEWPSNSGIILYKNGIQYDGTYRVKII